MWLPRGAEALRLRQVDFLQGYLYGKLTLEPFWREDAEAASTTIGTANKVA